MNTSEKMRCIIVDDEPIARSGMKRLIDANPELELAASLDSAESASAWLDENSADLIFLDIEMPGMDGMEFARSLPPSTMVIFTTAYSEYAADSYDLEAIDYLVKPINKERFNKAVSRAVAYRELLSAPGHDVEAESPDFIILKADRKYVRVKLEEIVYVEGLKDYVIVHLADRKVVTRMNLKGMEDLLPPKTFLRVSKSYIVNKSKIDSFTSKDVYIGTLEIAIGAPYRDSILTSLLT